MERETCIVDESQVYSTDRIDRTLYFYKKKVQGQGIYSYLIPPLHEVVYRM